MIRLATAQDAERLFALNERFNGVDETTLDDVRTSLSGNAREIVVVAEEDGSLAGFVCV